MPLSSRSLTPTPLVLVQPGTSNSTATSSTVTASRPQSPEVSKDVPHHQYGLGVSSTASIFPDSSTLYNFSRPSTSNINKPLPSVANGPASPSTGTESLSAQQFRSEEMELEALLNRLLIEIKVKDGAENLLQVFRKKNEREDLRLQVEAALAAANSQITSLEARIRELRSYMRDQQANDFASDDDMYSNGDLTTAAAASAMEILRSLSDDEEQSTSAGTSFAQQDRKIDALNRLLQIMQRDERIKWEIPIQDVTQRLLPQLAESSSQNLRAAAYRTLRYLQSTAADIQILISHGLELFLIKTFSRNASYDLEKSEALLLVKSWMPMHSKPYPLTQGLVRAIVAMCENSEDRLRLLALAVLSELSVYDMALLTRSEGLRVILQSFVEGPPELSPYLALVFLPIMDMPDARRMLRPGLDIELVVSAFSTAGSKTSSGHDEKLRTCAHIVGMYLRSWTGLMYLCMNNKQALRSFVGGLDSPSVTCRQAVMNTLFNVFRIEDIDALGNKAKRKSTDTVKARAVSDSSVRTMNGHRRDEPYNRLNLIEHYLGLILIVLVDAGLLSTLLAAKDRSHFVQRKGAMLVGELIALSNRVLPSHYATQWQSLPSIFNLASNFGSLPDRLVGTNVMSNIDRYSQSQTKRQAVGLSVQPLRHRANSLEDPLVRGQRHVETSRIRLGMQIDDLAWKSLLLETQVLLHKEYTKWDYNAILGVVEGPMLNPARLNEAIKGTKFVRRIIAFFYPFDKQYSVLENSPANLKWTKLACSLLTTLVANPDGIAFLQQDKLLRQIAEALSHLDPHYQMNPADAIFTEKQFAETLSSGYFAMLGTLSKHPEGLRLVEKAKIFTLFYRITDLKGREDIVTACIESLNYDIDAHTRVVLSKSLHSGYKHVRLFATKHLGRLLRDSTTSKQWVIQLLVTQLYDISTEVRDLAVAMLLDLCQDLTLLENVVELRPALDHLGPSGEPLLFRFLSTSVGVRYLHEVEFIECEMERWFHELNDQYTVQLEVNLAKAMSLAPKDIDDTLSDFDGSIPLHFYGELVKTGEGRMILEAKGHFREFAIFIREHATEETDIAVINKLKSVLWAVGHIGATTGGISFLEIEGCIDDIVDIAYSSKVLSLRGTCYYVLGLISSTTEGADLLDAAGWTSTYSPIGVPIGYCLPDNIDTFLEVPPWKSHRLSMPPQHDLGLPSNAIEREVMTALESMSNNLLTHQSSKTLARLKQKNPNIFGSKPLFYRAIQLLTTSHFRASVRSYILELFDVPLTVKTAEEVLAAGEATRRTKTDASTPQPSHRKTLSVNPMLRLDSESDSEEFSDEMNRGATADGAAAKLSKEVLEPKRVIRGFL